MSWVRFPSPAPVFRLRPTINDLKKYLTKVHSKAGMYPNVVATRRLSEAVKACTKTRPGRFFLLNLCSKLSVACQRSARNHCGKIVYSVARVHPTARSALLHPMAISESQGKTVLWNVKGVLAQGIACNFCRGKSVGVDD